MTILGIDAGNDSVKVVGEGWTDVFPSKLGDAYDRALSSELRKNDMIVEFGGKQWFAGSLAGDAELSSSKKGVSKANDEVLIRVLLAAFRASSDTDYDIVVGQPIKSHRDSEKSKIIKMLKTKHTITVNGTTRVINFRDVKVAAEGASVGLLTPQIGRYHILDVGSGTINWATVIHDGTLTRFTDKDSGTEEFGLSTLRQTGIEGITTYLYNNELEPRWKSSEPVRIVGAAAREFREPIRKYFPNAEVYEPLVGTKYIDPVYANAAAFYAIARTLHGKKS